MKKIIAILAIAAFTTNVVAQDKINKIGKLDSINTDKKKDSLWITTKNDTTRINLKNTNLQILIVENKNDSSWISCKDENKKKKNRHWRGLYLGVNGYVTSDYSLSLPAKSNFMELNYAKSIHFGMNCFEKDIHLFKDYAMLVTGIGFDFNNYALKNNISLLSNKDSVWGITDTVHNFSKNKLKTTFITVPLMLAFNTNEDSKKAFHFAAGVVFGYKIGSKVKQIDDDVKTKIKGDYNINPFRYDATVRVGFGNYNLYASYALNSLFEKGKGPELYPFTMGIKILGL